MLRRTMPPKKAGRSRVYLSGRRASQARSTVPESFGTRHHERILSGSVLFPRDITAGKSQPRLNKLERNRDGQMPRRTAKQKVDMGWDRKSRPLVECL